MNERARILSPDGTPISQPTPVTEGGFVVSSDFDPYAQLGMVKIEVPNSSLVAQLGQYLAHTVDCRIDDDRNIPCTCGLAGVIENAFIKFRMHPAEAKMMGARIIAEGEACIAATAFMRVGLRVMELSPGEALGLLSATMMDARTAHNQAFKRHIQLAEATKAMGGTDGQRQPS